jgi:3-hydroxybutyryl-CoA dehydrogenase
MRYCIINPQTCRAFTPGDAFTANASAPEAAEVAIVCSGPAPALDTFSAVLFELGTECLEERLSDADDPARAVGFARYSTGAPSTLIELVRGEATRPEALSAARAIFEAAGLVVCVCADRPGRIVDRLVRPKYNAALRFLDEGLATAEDIDATCRLGLGYPEGPLERVTKGGLERHYEVTKALYDRLAEPGYAPARRAAVAHARRG